MYSVEQSFVEWLADKGYAASTYPPKDGTEFVTVERTSGGVVDMIDHPTVAIQTWARTAPRAEEMALAIRNALFYSRPAGVAHIQVDGLYPFWDENTRLPRYQLVLDCTAQLTD